MNQNGNKAGVTIAQLIGVVAATMGILSYFLPYASFRTELGTYPLGDLNYEFHMNGLIVLVLAFICLILILIKKRSMGFNVLGLIFGVIILFIGLDDLNQISAAQAFIVDNYGVSADYLRINSLGVVADIGLYFVLTSGIGLIIAGLGGFLSSKSLKNVPSYSIRSDQYVPVNYVAQPFQQVGQNSPYSDQASQPGQKKCPLCGAPDNGQAICGICGNRLE